MVRQIGSQSTRVYLTTVVGCAQIWTNYINRPLPKGGNGWGAVGPGSQATQGALGLGEQIANATSQSFSLIAYCLPLVVGYLADSKFGRYPMIFWGIILCGVGHVLIVAGGAKTLIDNDTAKIPFFIGVYILAVGAGKFKTSSLSTVFVMTNGHLSHVQAQRHPIAARSNEIPRTESHHPEVWRASHRGPRAQH